MGSAKTVTVDNFCPVANSRSVNQSLFTAHFSGKMNIYGKERDMLVAPERV